MNNNRNISTFSPFITFCQHVIPLAYDESMSYYETLCALRNYLVNTVIPAINNNANAVTELQNKYTEFTNTINQTVKDLENYIDNYFKNLDVQTEINNKLDEMAESGELTDIIGQYLELNSVLAFNTRTDLKNANNLNDGSFTYCFGKDTYNDGYGAFYKIRKSINTDVADGENIIALTNYPALVAEKMPNKYLSDSISILESTLNQKIDDNYNTLNEKIENYEKQKITLVIGDSWTDQTETGKNFRDGADSWVEEFKQYTPNLVINQAVSGAGYARPGYKTFNEQYMEIINNDDYDNELIENIIIYGGLNDIDKVAYSEMKQGAINLANNIKANTPNAKVYCAFFNLPARGNTLANSKTTSQFIYDLNGYNWLFFRAAGWAHGLNNTWASDKYHPNAQGSHQIFTCVMAMVYGGEGISIPITVLDSSVEITSVDNSVRFYPFTGDLKGELVAHLNATVNANTRVPYFVALNFSYGFNANGAYTPTSLGIAASVGSYNMFTGFCSIAWQNDVPRIVAYLNFSSGQSSITVTTLATDIRVNMT